MSAEYFLSSKRNELPSDVEVSCEGLLPYMQNVSGVEYSCDGSFLVIDGADE
jgi:hypothetical protein